MAGFSSTISLLVSCLFLFLFLLYFRIEYFLGFYFVFIIHLAITLGTVQFYFMAFLWLLCASELTIIFKTTTQQHTPCRNSPPCTSPYHSIFVIFFTLYMSWNTIKWVFLLKMWLIFFKEIFKFLRISIFYLPLHLLTFLLSPPHFKIWSLDFFCPKTFLQALLQSQSYGEMNSLNLCLYVFISSSF